MIDHRYRLSFTDFAVEQRRAFALAKFHPALATAQVTDPIQPIDLAKSKVAPAGLAGATCIPYSDNTDSLFLVLRP
jgi:hypothetical protein